MCSSCCVWFFRALWEWATLPAREMIWTMLSTLLCQGTSRAKESLTWWTTAPQTPVRASSLVQTSYEKCQSCRAVLAHMCNTFQTHPSISLLSVNTNGLGRDMNVKPILFCKQVMCVHLNILVFFVVCLFLYYWNKLNYMKHDNWLTILIIWFFLKHIIK